MLYLFLLMFGLMFVAPIHESFSQLRIAKTSEVLITLYLPSLWSSGGWWGLYVNDQVDSSVKYEYGYEYYEYIYIYTHYIYVCMYTIHVHTWYVSMLFFWYTNEYVRNIKHMLQPLALTTKKSISGLFEVCPKNHQNRVVSYLRNLWLEAGIITWGICLDQLFVA